MVHVDTLGQYLLGALKLGYCVHFVGQRFFQCIPMGTRFGYNFKAFDNNVFFATLALT